jgi:hypothetical protein
MMVPAACALVNGLMRLLDTIPGRTGLAIHAWRGWVLVEIHVDSDDRVTEIAAEYQMSEPAIARGEGLWWRRAELAHGDVTLTLSGPKRQGAPPSGGASTAASATAAAT